MGNEARLLFLLVVVVISQPAYAKTGNFLPMVASFFVGVPALLLVPVIGIAASRPGPARKRPWIVVSLALAVLSFGTLWWAVQTFHLLATPSWPSIYLWTVPSFLLWLAFRHANR